MTNRKIAKEFVDGSIKLQFNLSDERAGDYIQLFTELFDYVIEEYKKRERQA